MTITDIGQVVDEFWAERQRGVHYPPQWFDRLDLDTAARVQLGLLERELAAGERHAGWKVGLTAAAIREQFSVHEPVFGYLLQGRRHATGAVLDAAGIVQPGIENEICLRLGQPLQGPGVDFEAARAAIDAVAPAFEVTETRGDFTAQLAVSVADNVQQYGFVVGEWVPHDGGLDLSAVAAQVEINGEPVASATSAAVMGSPVHSLVWLANKLAAFDRRLEAGDQITAGSLTRQFLLQPGDRVHARYGGIGEVEMSLR